MIKIGKLTEGSIPRIDIIKNKNISKTRTINTKY